MLNLEEGMRVLFRAVCNSHCIVTICMRKTLQYTNSESNCSVEQQSTVTDCNSNSTEEKKQ